MRKRSTRLIHELSLSLNFCGDTTFGPGPSSCVESLSGCVGSKSIPSKT